MNVRTTGSGRGATDDRDGTCKGPAATGWMWTLIADRLLRHASEKLSALPLWVRIGLTVQCFIPGVVLYFHNKVLSGELAECEKTRELIPLMQSLPEAQGQPLLSILADAAVAGQPATQAMASLVWLNIVAGLLGVWLLVLIWWPQRSGASAADAQKRHDLLDQGRRNF